MADPYYRPRLDDFDPGDIEPEVVPTEELYRTARVRRPFPVRVKGPFETRTVEEAPAEDIAPIPAEEPVKGIWSWRDEEGALHGTNTQANVPSGVDAKFTPEGPQPTEPGISPELIREFSIKGLAEAEGVPYETAKQAFAKAEEPIVKTYEQKVATRNKVVANIQREMGRARDAAEREEIRRQGDQFLKLHGLDKIKAPSAEAGRKPRFGVGVEAAAKAEGYESFADVPPGAKSMGVIQTAAQLHGADVTETTLARLKTKEGFREPSATERTFLADLKSSAASLEHLSTLYKDDFTGPIAGRAGAIQTATGIGLAKGEAGFRAATSAFRNQVIKTITGAQMSEPEAKRIRKQIPEENDPPEVWRAKQKEALRLLNLSFSMRTEILERGGYILGELSREPVSPAAPSVTAIPAAAPTAVAGTPPAPGATQAPNGKWYVPDPNRQGKYLEVR